MKSYTDLEQSKALAKILPLENADMIYTPIMDIDSISSSGFLKIPECYPFNECKNWVIKPLPCWSLSALLRVLPNGTDISKEEADTENERYMCTVGIKDDVISTFGKNPIDACYEMIIKLHEQNLL